MCLQRSLRILRKSIFETRARLAATRRGARLAPGKLRVPREGEGLSQTFLLERAEELGPVFKVWLPHKMTTCIVGHDIARRFLSETEGRIRAGHHRTLSPLFPHGFSPGTGRRRSPHLPPPDPRLRSTPTPLDAQRGRAARDPARWARPVAAATGNSVSNGNDPRHHEGHDHRGVSSAPDSRCGARHPSRYERL